MLGVTVFFEPLDYGDVGLRVLEGEATGWDALAVLPLVPGRLSKYIDEADKLRDLQKTRKLGDAYDNTKRFNNALDIKILNRGSTGRTAANNLPEDIFMRSVISDPLANSKELTNIKLKDPRWAAKDGWVKMERVMRDSNGKGVSTIHFNYNKESGDFDDFKFTDNKE